MKKKVYLVRHGESEGNVGAIRQTADTSLTENGRKQAVFIAGRCEKLPIDIVISSTMHRARETAAAILEKTDAPVVYSDLFIERRRVSATLGKPKDDPYGALAEKEIKEKFHLPGFRFADEENFDDLKARAKEAFTYLAARSEEHVLVVTHGYFMRIMFAYLVFGDEMTGEQCMRIIKTCSMTNTGLTVFVYDTEDEASWRLRAWNDTAHLG